MTQTYQALIDGGLPQRSRATRRDILKRIQQRLIHWNPPAWVLDDLVAFARDARPDVLRSALLLHVPRQDTVLYNVVQRLVRPRWREGERFIARADVQRFLDQEEATYPEVGGWTHATHAKLAGNMLSILRDYGLLQGTARKRIVEPVVPPEAVQHLAQLLQAEGVKPEELAHHPDWQLWLWDAARAQTAISQGVQGTPWATQPASWKPWPSTRPVRYHTGQPGGPMYVPAPAHGFEDQPTGADLLLDRVLIREHFPSRPATLS